jgi:hypothetical protein
LHSLDQQHGGESLTVQVEMRALANLALQSRASGRPREALRYAAGAERPASDRVGSARIKAIPQMRPATTNAVMGNVRDTDRAIGQARRYLEHEAIDGYTKNCARNVALYRVRMARARLDMTEIAGAALAAHAALDDVEARDVASRQITTDLDAVAQRLNAYPTVDEATSFVGRYADHRHTAA